MILDYNITSFFFLGDTQNPENIRFGPLSRPRTLGLAKRSLIKGASSAQAL